MGKQPEHAVVDNTSMATLPDWVRSACTAWPAVQVCVHVQINNGVYKSGFSTRQAAYDKAQEELYSALEAVEKRLGQHRFLVGDK